MHTRVSSTRFFVVHFVAKQYILQQKCPKGQIGTQLNSSLLTKGSRMAKTYTVDKKKANDQSE